MKNKTYKLEIVSLDDDSGYYSKGHHDKQLFAETANREFAIDVIPEKVYHTYLRKRWLLPNEQGAYNFEYFVCSSEKGKQGAFPATVYGF